MRSEPKLRPKPIARSKSKLHADRSSRAVASGRPRRVARVGRTTAASWTVVVLGVALATGAVIMTGDPYLLLIGTYIAINALLALSLQLLFGYTGQISFAQAGFYGVGAYATALLMTRAGAGFTVSVLVGALIAATLAGIVGVPTLRLRGHYLAIATLALQVGIYQFYVQASGLTGGTVGVFAIPRPQMLIPGLPTDEQFLVLVVLVALGAYFLAWLLLRSGFGRQMLAVREDETAAESLGIPSRRVKVTVFAVSALLAAVAGSFYASYIGFISPVTFNLDWSIAILAMVVVGGMGRLSGAALGAALITGVNQVLSVAGRMEFLVFGLLIVAILVVLPRGVAGGLHDLFSLLRRRLGSEADTADSAKVLSG